MAKTSDRLPEKPPNEYAEVVYSNLNHLIDQEVVDFLVHNQDHYAQHAAKGYCGYVFAQTQEVTPGVSMVVWFEEMWEWHMLRCVYSSYKLEEVIGMAIEEFGYA